MSLKAKLEAVIYAAEEPVTLNQLAALFSTDALEWKAAQEAAAREQAAEIAGEPPLSDGPLPLLNQGVLERVDPSPDAKLDASLDYLGLADTPALYTEARPDPPAETTGALAEPATAKSESAPGDPDAGTAEPAGSTSESVITEADRAETTPETEPSLDPESGPAAAAEEPSSAGSPESPSPPDDSPSTVLDIEAESKRLARLRDREVKAVLKQILDELVASSENDGRGVEIREIAGGYRMATKPECHDAVRLFVKSLKPAMKLSLPALETLAVVAYKQPVTAPEVNEIRGVESAGVLGSLLARKLVATAGRKQVIGRPILYKTTREFLLRFGLKDLSELPSMEEFEKMAALELEEPGDSESIASTQEASTAEYDSAPEENAEAILESNSPSGEEMAGAVEEAETTNESASSASRQTPQSEEQAIESEDAPDPAPLVDSHASEEPAGDGDEAAGDPAAEQGSGPAADELPHPADPPEPAQNEASHHGKEDQQDH